ncbi:tRNA 4-thiouridine(8) synthase ThiI [Candidatus Peregrinibacteria bacterium]|nr:tRNA 4-thiouridine(8) synthase ThiI [Candidatus Peregrinibacteria bacterium]
MKSYILIHYGEIGLKKANADYYIGKLRKNIKLKLEKRFRKTFSVKYTLGRILVKLPDNFSLKRHKEKYVEVLNKVCGIKNYKFVFAGSLDIKKLSNQIFENLPDFIFDSKEKPDSFRVKVKRSMVLPYKSYEIEGEIGANLLKNEIDISVKMKDPEFVVDIEFFNNYGYFSFKKHEGIGGFPSNSQGKLVSLISAGIDSPVAAFLLMKRGARIIFVHFHGYPYTDKNEMEQSKELIKILSEYQFDTKVYIIPFGNIQKKIATNLEIPGKVRTILYRRIMLRIAEKISKKEKTNGIVTGDNFGQVASQTPENIFAIHDVSNIPVFQPLIGYDKEEIIKIAEKIGTFKISKLPCKESCTMFMPKKPELRANVMNIREYEGNIPIDNMIGKSLENSKIINF